jgi:hypothetical protein
MNWFSFLLARLSEPSTYAGIAAAASQVSAASHGDPVAIGTVLAGVAGILMPEKKP